MFSQSTVFALVAAISALSAQATDIHRHHQHNLFNERAEEAVEINARGATCAFPTDAGLVSVTPNSLNAGWALSPDRACEAGSWCPYACPPGQVSMQWDPSVTTYSYPGSQYGGLYCNANGELEMPYSDRPYCQDGTGFAVARNLASQDVAFCQTVLPGNEAMLIPTNVKGNGKSTLAVPDTSYWAGTSAHFYINAPGYNTDTACVWGTSSNPYGNWAPYVGGANTDDSGNTFVKIGWNPVYLEEATPFRNEVPTFGVRIVCDGDACNGDPCEIDPSVVGVNGITGSDSSGTAGGAFCVVTAPKGVTAYIEVFETGSSNSKREVIEERDANFVSTQVVQRIVTSTVTVAASTASSVVASSSNSSSSVEAPRSTFAYAIPSSVVSDSTYANSTSINSTSNSTALFSQVEQSSGSSRVGTSIAAIASVFVLSALFA